MRGAKAVADPADPGEIKLTLEVASARQELRRDGIEHGLEADTVTGIEFIAARWDVHPQMARLVRWIETGQRVIFDDDPPAPFYEVDIDDAAAHHNRPQMPLQHRCLALPGDFAHQCETGGKKG